MSIDIRLEKLLTFGEAITVLPSRPNISTVHRWRLKGVRGVRLETVLVGGRRYTSVEAIERFAAATTASGDGQTTTIRSPRAREIAIRRAEQELDDKESILKKRK